MAYDFTMFNYYNQMIRFNNVVSKELWSPHLKIRTFGLWKDKSQKMFMYNHYKKALT